MAVTKVSESTNRSLRAKANSASASLTVNEGYETNPRYLELFKRECEIEDEIDRRDDHGLAKEDLMDELDQVRMEMDRIKQCDFIMQKYPVGTTFVNQNGVAIKITDPDKTGKIQYNVHATIDSPATDCKATEPESLEKILSDNGYELVKESVEYDFEDITNMSDAKDILRKYGIELVKKDDRNYILSKGSKEYTFYVLSNPNDVREDLIRATKKLTNDSTKDSRISSSTKLSPGTQVYMPGVFDRIGSPLKQNKIIGIINISNAADYGYKEGCFEWSYFKKGDWMYIVEKYTGSETPIGNKNVVWNNYPIYNSPGIYDSVKDSVESDFSDITNMSDAREILKKYGIELIKKDDRNYILKKGSKEYSFYVLSNPSDVRDDLIKAIKKLCNISESKKDVCVICGKEIEDYGNNAAPVKDGRCCDDCHYNVVVPARLKGCQNKKLGESANTNHNSEFDYKLMDRLRSDCEYFINYFSGKGTEKVLWAGNVADQIAKMKELYDKVPVKPEWLTMQDIEGYEYKMNQLLGNNVTESVKKRFVKVGKVKVTESAAVDKLKAIMESGEIEFDSAKTFKFAPDLDKMRTLDDKQKQFVIDNMEQIDRARDLVAEAYDIIASLRYSSDIKGMLGQVLGIMDQDLSQAQTNECLNGEDAFENSFESTNLDPEDNLTESFKPVFGDNDAEDITDYSQLLEKYYGKEAVTLAKENDLSAKSVYFFMECHGALDPILSLKEELENDFDKKEFTALYE